MCPKIGVDLSSATHVERIIVRITVVAGDHGGYDKL